MYLRSRHRALGDASAVLAAQSEFASGDECAAACTDAYGFDIASNTSCIKTCTQAFPSSATQALQQSGLLPPPKPDATQPSGMSDTTKLWLAAGAIGLAGLVYMAAGKKKRK